MKCFNCESKEYVEGKHHYTNKDGFKHFIDVIKCKECETILVRKF